MFLKGLNVWTRRLTFLWRFHFESSTHQRRSCLLRRQPPATGTMSDQIRQSSQIGKLRFYQKRNDQHPVMIPSLNVHCTGSIQCGRDQNDTTIINIDINKVFPHSKINLINIITNAAMICWCECKRHTLKLQCLNQLLSLFPPLTSLTNQPGMRIFRMLSSLLQLSEYII